MSILVKILMLIIAPLVSIYIYYYSSFFKVLGTASNEEMNEEEHDEEEQITEKEGRIIRIIGTSLFVIIGIIVWGQLAVIIGKIVGDLTENIFLKIIAVFLGYFILIRIPFGTGNRMVKRMIDNKPMPEKIVFIIVILVLYVLSINYYESLPNFMKFPFLIIPN
jgi:hypothetical protein